MTGAGAFAEELAAAPEAGASAADPACACGDADPGISCVPFFAMLFTALQHKAMIAMPAKRTIMGFGGYLFIMILSLNIRTA